MPRSEPPSIQKSSGSRLTKTGVLGFEPLIPIPQGSVDAVQAPPPLILPRAVMWTKRTK